MAVLSKQRGRSRGLVFALIWAFGWSLGLPQVGTLRHDHPGSDRAHTHPELAIYPFAPARLHHDESHPHHTPHLRGQSDVADLHRTPLQPSATAEAGLPTTLAYTSADTSGVGHWHTYKIVRCARLIHSVPLLLARRCLSCRAFIQTLPVAATLTAFQPRAPPVLLSLDHKQS